MVLNVGSTNIDSIWGDVLDLESLESVGVQIFNI